ncbi:thioredoxin domain-containing protein [Chitinophaga silvisoli]|uniref:DUF255 domain-containing protein n=1 Tax=Chitinophaga silvisoli TaxID=2291814 RepID=A0A3E1NXZ0_9BACT|nr:thioredoxin domain-containing protein [Chitinophaga silvisoli]RFM32793.1 DUF255 domain-containing protein [Chitinophaga silvisoli]
MKKLPSAIKRKSALLLIVLLILSFSQLEAQGIQFASSDLATAINMAKQQNKLLFIDMYTDWCGPCKMMEKEIFPLEKVGQLYNENFICCRINAEKTVGPDLVKKYEVEGYPTFLFITPEGDLIAKGIGYKESPDPFIELGRSAIHKKEINFSVSKMRERYEDNKNNKEFLATYIPQLDSLGLKIELESVLNQYCKILKTPLDADFNLLIKYVFKVNSGAFDFLLENQVAAYQYFNPDSLFPNEKYSKQVQFEGIFNNIIIEGMMDAIAKKNVDEFNQAIARSKKMDHHSPKFPLSISAFSAQFYTRMQDTVAAIRELHHFSDTLLPAILPVASSLDSLEAIQHQTSKGNYLAYLAHITNVTADKFLRYSKLNSDFQKALSLSQQSLKLKPNEPEYLNTSARSYYLLKNKAQAIKIQQQAIEYSKDNKSINEKLVSQLADMQAGKEII